MRLSPLMGHSSARHPTAHRASGPGTAPGPRSERLSVCVAPVEGAPGGHGWFFKGQPSLGLYQWACFRVGTSSEQLESQAGLGGVRECPASVVRVVPSERIVTAEDRVDLHVDAGFICHLKSQCEPSPHGRSKEQRERGAGAEG